jgi:hypothetical protein
MRGLIYKNISTFFKCTEKKPLLIVAGTIILLYFNAGIYAGLYSSVMLAMAVGMQNILTFSFDEKVDWKKYQLAMPINAFAVVASKYISVVYTMAVSVLGSVVLNIASGIIFREFHVLSWVASIAAAIIIPLIWTGVCLPLSYWFGYRSAQTMGMIVIIPEIYLIKCLEDRPEIGTVVNSVYSLILIAGIAAGLIFVISLVISTIGYSKKN